MATNTLITVLWVVCLTLARENYSDMIATNNGKGTEPSGAETSTHSDHESMILQEAIQVPESTSHHLSKSVTTQGAGKFFPGNVHLICCLLAIDGILTEIRNLFVDHCSWLFNLT